MTNIEDKIRSKLTGGIHRQLRENGMTSAVESAVATVVNMAVSKVDRRLGMNLHRAISDDQ